ncbi:hypothetical protein B0H14DRAFT_2635300 [Mycena olivaceomarginata]|nr:hypothetical protein B0H14DRAFT_2635300 [Mycena olivaceomarginata]
MEVERVMTHYGQLSELIAQYSQPRCREPSRSTFSREKKQGEVFIQNLNYIQQITINGALVVVRVWMYLQFTFYRTIFDNKTLFVLEISRVYLTGLETRGCIEDPRVTRTGFRPDPYTGTVFAGPGTDLSLKSKIEGIGWRLMLNLHAVMKEARYIEPGRAVWRSTALNEVSARLMGLAKRSNGSGRENRSAPRGARRRCQPRTSARMASRMRDEGTLAYVAAAWVSLEQCPAEKRRSLDAAASRARCPSWGTTRRAERGCRSRRREQSSARQHAGARRNADARRSDWAFEDLQLVLVAESSHLRGMPMSNEPREHEAPSENGREKGATTPQMGDAKVEGVGAAVERAMRTGDEPHRPCREVSAEPVLGSKVLQRVQNTSVASDGIDGAQNPSDFTEILRWSWIQSLQGSKEVQESLEIEELRVP